MLKSGDCILILFMVMISGLVYLPFVAGFGYFNDDWYLMYAAGAKGASVFREIYSVDRPMRALVMTPAYVMFANNQLLYNLSAWGFRTLSAVFFFLFLDHFWPRRQQIVWATALLYLIYPGFLSQFNGIDYQSQMVSLAVGMFSLLSIAYAYGSKSMISRLGWLLVLTVSTGFYLGLVEYFIGFEVLKLVCVTLLVFRNNESWLVRARRIVLWSVYSLVALLPFLVWRLFFFQSERGATDINMQFDNVLSDPAAFLANWFSNLLSDMTDVLLYAWINPLKRVGFRLTDQEWIVGSVIAGVVLLLVWVAFRLTKIPKDNQIDGGLNWRREAVWMGGVMLMFGLLPVILVGRYVDFRSFSRYALAPSVGVVLLLQGCLNIFPVYIRNIVIALLIASSSLTHYAYGLVRVHETEATRNFWWQVSWRIPQMGQGTTLLVHYPAVTMEEDYFVWGPANLIYYPESMHADYPQPGIYSVVMNEETVEKIFARERQEYSERRSIRTYPNYRNVLIITQPSTLSCVQVIDGLQPEFSPYEDGRYIKVGAFSEVEHIDLEALFRQPPEIPFGLEPEHDWCFYYEKAAYARQRGDWNAVLQSGEQAFGMGMFPKDQIEWMPFLQGYAVSGNSARLSELDRELTDPSVREQACRILGNMSDLSAETHGQTQKLFCSN